MAVHMLVAGADTPCAGGRPLPRSRGYPAFARGTAGPRGRSGLRRPRCAARTPSRPRTPDVVVTDIRMPPDGIDEGIQAALRLRETRPGARRRRAQHRTREPSYALALLEGGTAGRAYLLKERVDDIEQLAAAIRAVAEGGSVIDPKVVEALVAEKARDEESPLSQLTPRERDVLREMAEGKNNAGDRRSARAHGAVGREGHPLDLPQARAGLGARRSQARQGGDPLPVRRAASERQGETSRTRVPRPAPTRSPDAPRARPTRSARRLSAGRMSPHLQPRRRSASSSDGSRPPLSHRAASCSASRQQKYDSCHELRRDNPEAPPPRC